MTRRQLFAMLLGVGIAPAAMARPPCSFGGVIIRKVGTTLTFTPYSMPMVLPKHLADLIRQMQRSSKLYARMRVRFPEPQSLTAVAGGEN